MSLIATVNSLMNEVALVIYTLDGQTLNTKRSQLLHDLHGKFIDYDSVLEKEEAKHDGAVIAANFNAETMQIFKDNPITTVMEIKSIHLSRTTETLILGLSTIKRKVPHLASKPIKEGASNGYQNNSLTCQYCDQPGHAAKRCCFKLQLPVERTYG